LSLYMSFCPACAAKQEAERLISPVGGKYYGACQGSCMGRPGQVQQYEIGVSREEAERHRRRARAGRPRAGERKRA